jgi:uncharacterized membrane protein
MQGFISNDRLKSFSDSVLVVAVVLLVYNLATLATSEPEFFEFDTFFHALVAYVSSFIVVFFYWSRFTLLLDHVKSLDDTIVLISLAFLILVTLTPVSYIGLLQLKSQTALIFTSINQILAGGFLALLWRIVTKDKDKDKDKDKTMGPKARYFFFQICLIPLVYIASLLISYLDFTTAFILPLFILPIFLLVRVRYRKTFK